MKKDNEELEGTDFYSELINKSIGDGHVQLKPGSNISKSRIVERVRLELDSKVLASGDSVNIDSPQIEEND